MLDTILNNLQVLTWNYIRWVLLKIEMIFLWDFIVIIGNNRDLGHEVNTAFLLFHHIFRMWYSTGQRRNQVPNIKERKVELGSQSSSASFSSLVPYVGLGWCDQFHAHWLEMIFFSSLPPPPLASVVMVVALDSVLFYFGENWWRIPLFNICLLIPIFLEMMVSAYSTGWQFTN